METGNDQISRFLSRLPTESNTETDPNAPLAAFSSALELTREQEEEMTAHCMNRYNDLSSELGRDGVVGSGGGSSWYSQAGGNAKRTSQSFMGKRQLYEMVYHNNVEWRAYLLGGIFEEHNLVIPSARRVIQQQIARADNYFFGSDPWITAMPVGSGDIELADSVDRWTKHRFDQVSTIEAHKQANEGAFIRGEDVIKTTYRKVLDFHQTVANIMVDPNGQPFLASDNDYIFGDDFWIENPDGQKILRRDNQTVAPDWALVQDEAGGVIINQDFFETRKVDRSIVKRKGSESRVIYYTDFLCPLSAESVEDADCVVHIYDEPAIDIASKLLDRIEQNPEPGQLPRLMQILNNIAGSSGERNSAKESSRPEEGESELSDNTGSDRDEAVVNLGEFYIWYDPFGDGRGRRNIVVLIDLESREPLYYDYVANVTPDAKRPFHVVRINPINGRWHGTGNMETYWPLQEMIDLLANRWNMSQSGSARVDFWNPYATVEGTDDPTLKVNGGQTYTLKPNKTADDALKSVYLTDIKSDRIHEQIQYLQQHLMNMSGVSNANDSRSAGLDTAQLATGINNIQASGEELFNPWLSHLTPGHRSAAKSALLIEIEHMDDNDFYHFMEGGSRIMATVSKAELRYLDLDVKIELTRYRTEREIIQNEKSFAVFDRFYHLPLILQAKWAPHAKRTLSNLEVRDSETLIEPNLFSYVDNMGLPPSPPTETVSSGLGAQRMQL